MTSFGGSETLRSCCRLVDEACSANSGRTQRLEGGNAFGWSRVLDDGAVAAFSVNFVVPDLEVLPGERSRGGVVAPDVRL